MKRTVHDKWKAVTALLLSIALTACAVGPSASESSDRLATAKAMFAQRCRAAGERIYRTADNVEGIYLLKIRPEKINYNEQFVLDDPYGRDLSGISYIKSFLRGSYQAETTGVAKAGSPPRLGYMYVVAADEKGGLYKYIGRLQEHEVTSSVLVGGTGKKFKTTEFVVEKIIFSGAAPRYGVSYDDISTKEERDYWIAGSSLKIIDLETKEIVAERIGYMIDLAQGNTVGGRSPWLFAADHACPKFAAHNGASAQGNQTLDFAEKVLRPKVN